jgi:tetratricopeptide (TPR) repeat protein
MLLMTSEHLSEYVPTTSHLPGLLFLFIIVLLSYSNTFDAGWHLDDFPKIVKSERLHINDLKPQTLLQTFYSLQEAENRIYRPLACLTLALNWYVGRDAVAGYHLVNIAIHFLTAVFLFLTLINLFRSPRLKAISRQAAHFIALLAALLWACNPIQTQAVTYIVQRMASLAALFYILSMLCYIKGRLAGTSHQRRWFYAGCLASFICALGTKENTITLPAALLLLEILFFQDFDHKTRRTRTLVMVIAVSGAVLALGVAVMLLRVSWSDFQQAYAIRSFSMIERLLTQPRVVIFYLTQIFFPLPARLSIEHDVTISSSLFAPWTTLPAVLLVLVLIGLGLLQVKKRPLLALAVLFFFLNHLIESSILPLELVFEHRNYLPSLFLFVPVAAGLKAALDYCQQRQRGLYFLLIGVAITGIIGFGVGTYQRNKVWATEKSLWEDAIAKAPGRARPAYTLAKNHYNRTGDLGKAKALYNRALYLEASTPHTSQAKAFNSLGSIYYQEKNYPKVVEMCRRALAVQPGFESAQFNMTLAWIKMGAWTQAGHMIDQLLARHVKPAYVNIKGFILLKQNNPRAAMPFFKKVLQRHPDDPQALLNLGAALHLAGDYAGAEKVLQRLLQRSPKNIVPLLFMIDNRLAAGDVQTAQNYQNQLMHGFSLADISKNLSQLPGNPVQPPFQATRVNQVLGKYYQALSGEIAAGSGPPGVSAMDLTNGAPK